MKEQATVAQICEGLPQFMSDFVSYAKGLDFAQKPDYEHCTNLFQKYAQTMKYENDNEFDWQL